MIPSIPDSVSAPDTGEGVDSDFRIVEPRCKVCQSEHRRAIDAMLRRGDSQASVRRNVNEALGHSAFTANNLSVHAQRHLYGPDPSDWVRKRAHAQRMLGDPTAAPPQTRPEDALRTILDVGLDLIHAGVTVPESGDVIRAAAELRRIEREGRLATEEEMLGEIKAFTRAVKSIVPQEMWQSVYEEYERLLAKA
jgi:hypothetical protein